MGKLKSCGEFLKIFFSDLKEDWDYTDKKLLKIIIFAATFALSALFWLYFFQSSSPFSFG
jgi:hypothetical protein